PPFPVIISRSFHVVSGRNSAKLYDEFSEDWTLTFTVQSSGSPSAKVKFPSPELPPSGTASTRVSVASVWSERMAVKVSFVHFARTAAGLERSARDNAEDRCILNIVNG